MLCQWWPFKISTIEVNHNNGPRTITTQYNAKILSTVPSIRLSVCHGQCHFEQYEKTKSFIGKEKVFVKRF